MGAEDLVTPATIDLTSMSNVGDKSRRAMRSVTLVISALTAVVLILILMIAFAPGNLSTSQEWTQFLVVVPGLVCMIALMLFTRWKLGPGATSVTVNRDGLRFTWGTGRSEHLPWHRISRGFVIVDYTITPAIPRLTGISWELRRANRPITYLTEAAFRAIVEGARQSGLGIDSVIPHGTDFRHNFWGWIGCRIIRFNSTVRAQS